MTNWWVVLLGAAIGAGMLQMIGNGIRWLIHWQRSSVPEKVQQQKIHDQVAQADQSIMVVSRSRDALEKDNERLRQEMATKDARHDAERAEWREERAELRREIDAMESRLQTALNEVQALKQRHGMNG